MWKSVEKIFKGLYIIYYKGRKNKKSFPHPLFTPRTEVDKA